MSSASRISYKIIIIEYSDKVERERERERERELITMFVKSAPPTPTMTMESGNLDAATILSTVLCISDMTPSYKEHIQSPVSII